MALEPTATNPQTGEKIVLRNGQWVAAGSAPAAAPSPARFPGIIQGAPEAPPQATPPSPFTVQEAGFDNATKLRTEFQSLPAVKDYQTVIRQYDSALKTEPTPTGDQALITAYAKMLDPTSVVREQEFSTVAEGDSAVGKLYTKLSRELGLGDSGLLRPEVRERVRNEMLNLVKSYNSSYNQARGQYEEFATRSGVDPNLVLGEHFGAPFKDTIFEARKEYHEEKNAERGGAAAGGGQRASPFPGVLDAQGNPLGPEGGMGYDAEGNELGLYGRVTDESPTEAERLASDPRVAEGDKAVLARQGFTLGLSDEAAGVGGAIGNLLQGENPIAGYRLWRDVEREQVDRARGNLGGVGTAIEIGSGFGGIGSGANALLTVGRAARQGAGIGAVGGFGYGEGAEGSSINALGGAALGGALGAGGQAVGNALARRAGSQGAQAAERGQRAQQLQQAGQAEGVTVNRAMVDPALENRVTGVDATLVGGPRIQREMRNIEGQVESRVSELGQGGRPMNEVTGGQTIERAGKRFIKSSGRQAKTKYDRAEQLAGDAKVTPTQSLQQVDAIIADLSETSSTSAKEVAFLQTIREDLTKDLSVRGLRRIRTNLRKKISTGDLVFGEDEARVLGVMDAAADDIRAGLTSQGKDKAARAFDAADKAYRARMEYIGGTVQRIMGKRNANVPAEQMWRRFESMASGRGDAVGLRKFYATLTPEERVDVAATFADELGKNNAGDFSVAHFLSQSEKLSDDAIKTIFGPEGAQSVQNLRTLGREVKRVTGAMNSRKSGTGVANSYRGWLFDGLLGAVAGGGGMSAGGLSGAAIAGGATALGANALRNAISARMLTSTKFTNWLKQAPNTTNPQAINRHYERLGEIAKAEPALAGDIEVLRNAIMQAANDNASQVSRSVAQDSEQ